MMKALLDAHDNGGTYVIINSEGRVHRGRVRFEGGKATLSRRFKNDVLKAEIPFDEISSVTDLKTHVQGRLDEAGTARSITIDYGSGDTVASVTGRVVSREGDLVTFRPESRDGSKRALIEIDVNDVLELDVHAAEPKFARGTAKHRAAPPPIPEAAKKPSAKKQVATHSEATPPPVPEIARKSAAERRSARLDSARKARQAHGDAESAAIIRGRAKKAKAAFAEVPADQEIKIIAQDGNGMRVDLRGYLDHVEGDTAWIRKTPDVVTENYREVSVELTAVRLDDVFEVTHVVEKAKPRPPRPPEAPNEFAASVDSVARDRIYAMRDPELTNSVTLANGRVVQPGDEIRLRAPKGEDGSKLRRVETISVDGEGYAVLNMDDGSMLPAMHVGQVTSGEGKPLVELGAKEIAADRAAAAKLAKGRPKSVEDFGRGARAAETGELKSGTIVRGVAGSPAKSSKLISPAARSYTVRHVILADKKVIGVELTNGKFMRIEELEGWKFVDPDDASLLEFRKAQAEAANPVKKTVIDDVPARRAPPPLPKSARKTPPPVPKQARKRAQRVEQPIDPEYAGKSNPAPADDVEEFYPMPDGRIITPGHTVSVRDKKSGTKRPGRIVGFTRDSNGETAFVVRLDDDDSQLILNPKSARSYGDGANQAKKRATPPPIPKARAARVATQQVDTLDPAKALVTLSDGTSVKIGDKITRQSNGRAVVIDKVLRNEDGKSVLVGRYEDSGKGVALLPHEAKAFSEAAAASKAEKGAFRFAEGAPAVDSRPKSETEFGRYAVARAYGEAPGGRTIAGGHGTHSEEYTMITDAAGNRHKVTQVVRNSRPIEGGKRKDNLLGVRLEDGTYLYADELAAYDIETVAYVPMKHGYRIKDKASGRVYEATKILKNFKTGERVGIKLGDGGFLDAAQLENYDIIQGPSQ